MKAQIQKEAGSYTDVSRVRRAQGRFKPEEVFLRIAETFKAMGDPTRVKLIQALASEELCVGDLASLLGVSDSAVSYQLRILRNLHLVKYRRDGKAAYYSLDDDHIDRLFKECVRHVEDQMGIQT